MLPHSQRSLSALLRRYLVNFKIHGNECQHLLTGFPLIDIDSHDSDVPLNVTEVENDANLRPLPHLPSRGLHSIF